MAFSFTLPSASARVVLVGTLFAGAQLGSAGCDTGPLPAPLPVCEVEAPSDAPAVCDEIRSASLVSQQTYPGDGVVARFRVENASGELISADVAACFRALDATLCDGVPSESTTVPAAPGQLALIVAVGGDSEESRRAQQVALELLAFLGEGVPVAIYRWGTRLSLLLPYTTDRGLLARQLATDLGTAPERAPIEDLLNGSAEELSTYRRDTRGVRAVAVVAPEYMLGSVQFDPRLSVRWAVAGLSPDSGANPLTPTGHVTLSGEANPGERLGENLNRLFTAPNVEVAVCAPVGTPVSVTANPMTTVGPIVSEPVRSFPSVVCEPANLDRAALRAPDAIALSFDAPQRGAYAERLDTRDKMPFGLSVTLGGVQAPVPAVARLRGQSSLGCARPNYTVNLEGGDGYPLVDGLRSDEFYLISMCLDDRYLNQFTADLLLEQQGLFPMAFGLVPLTVDGVSQGVYLFMEKPHEHARAQLPRLGFVLRRGLDSDGKVPEVKFSVGPPENTIAAYMNFVASIADRAPGQALEDYLRASMDLDQYLRWIALMTLLGNGDYVDEVYIVATETARADGTTANYFSHIAWDPDDLFSPCHHGGRFALEDPHGLLYCVEGLIDFAMFADSHIYGLYVDVLEEMMNERVTAVVFDSALDQTLSTLLPHFADADIRNAMVELIEQNPGAVEEAEAAADIRRRADAMRASFRAREAELRAAIATYRSAL